jgi:hypothetical protein
MSSIATELAELLGTIRRPGDFFAAGMTEFLAPRLEVEGVGPVALPLLPMQAEQLVAVAERAPYGRGADTIVDTNVRRTWQIAADRVRIGGKHWERTLQAVVARVAEGLGVGEPIATELYKLLVYDQGSFFTSHRDTEKSAGMFGTLVLALTAQGPRGAARPALRRPVGNRLRGLLCRLRPRSASRRRRLPVGSGLQFVASGTRADAAATEL